MISFKKIGLTFTLFVLVSALQAQPDLPKVEEHINRHIAQDNMQGASVVYIHLDGRTEFISKGYTTPGESMQVTQNTIFEIGSITKTFTALMMTKMIEEGAFSLDTPIETLLPDSLNVPSYEGQKITLKHLVTHTAGLPSVPGNMFPAPDRLNPYANYTVAQMYDFLSGYELTEAPGTNHAYSNLEFGLLGHVLELKSGMSFEALLQHFISNPLAMEDTFISVPDSKKDRFAEPYNYGTPVKHWDFLTLAGAGAGRSTAQDMATYMKAQMGLQQSNLESAIKKTHELRFDTGSGHVDDIGLGWFYSTKEDTLVWHNGGTGGFKSFAGYNKETGAAAVVLSSGKQSVDAIGFYLLDSKFSLPEIDTVTAAKTEPLGSYTGTYQHSSGIKYYVSREEDQLRVQITGQSVNPVFPKSENRFFYKIVEAEIEFSDKESGQFQKLTLYQGGQEIPAKRISDETGPPQRKEVDIDPALFDRYAGTYQIQPGFSITVTKEGNQLMTQATGQQKLPVYPESETKFFLKVVEAQIEFIAGENGKFNTIKLYQGGRVMEGNRIKQDQKK